MKTKSKIVFIIICITLMLTMVMKNISYATTVTNASDKLYVGITELRKNDTPNWGYAIGNPNDGGSKIWNLEEFTAATGSDLKPSGSKNIYCLKSGLGFRNTNERKTYDFYYDMKSEKGKIANHGVLSSLVNGTIVTKIGDKTEEVSTYGSILALLDMFYLLNNDNDVKMEYLSKAGIDDEIYDTFLTRDEIKSVQQAAL